MIITKTPYRVSFFGGGTDYRPYFMEYGGSVISTTIDKYCYISVRKLPPFFDHSIIVKYSKIETVKTKEELNHPSVRECLKYMGLDDISIAHDGDLPAKAGLGTSSSFTVGLLHALYALQGKYRDGLSLAKEAIHVEQDLIKENVGVQDQLAVAVGGFNRIYFSADGYEINPIVISKKRKQELEGNLLMFFTGMVRFASEIADEQVKNTKNKIQELREMASLVDEAENILQSGANLSEFGTLLDYTWKLKRSLSTRITNPTIDNLYDKAMQAGALGGKLLGAGGGGFMLVYAEDDKKEAVRKAMDGYMEIPFHFEPYGSNIVHFTEETC